MEILQRQKRLRSARKTREQTLSPSTTGGAGLGVFDAAKEYDFYAIGCNSNQNTVNPEHIVASILKRVDTASYDIAKSAIIDKDLAVGTQYLSGLSDEGMDYTLKKARFRYLKKIFRSLTKLSRRLWMEKSKCRRQLKMPKNL